MTDYFLLFVATISIPVTILCFNDITVNKVSKHTVFVFRTVLKLYVPYRKYQAAKAF